MTALKNKELLITGGTGSLGKEILSQLLEYHFPKGVRIYSRDELKQWELRQSVKAAYAKRFNLKRSVVKDSEIPVSYLIGDVRDCERLEMATKGVDIIIHCAALKQVPSCEYNPIEAKKTNIDGAENVIKAAIKNKVSKVMNISTDKAVYPINLYGMTKAVAEKLFNQANVYSGASGRPAFASCRYGNVIGSRGSIFPLFKKQIKENGKITVTHKDMTRFFISLQYVAEFVLKRIASMKAGETYIPKMYSAHIMMIAGEFVKRSKDAKNTKENITEIGIRSGEKIHETLITKEEGRSVAMANSLDYYILQSDGLECSRIEYKSNTNSDWLSGKDIRTIIDGL